MKTHLKILIPLTLLTIVALITACQKEDLKPKDTTATLRQSIPNEESNPLALTDRRPMNTSIYTGTIETLPVNNYQDLLKLTANCSDRQKVASQHNIEYQDLTIATEIADLQRTGMTLIEAAMLQAATNPQYLRTQPDFIGVTDIIASRNQNIDVGLLAHMPAKPFFKVVLNFYENLCSNCKDAPAPSFQRISKFIKTAQQLPVIVSYQQDGKCLKVNQGNKLKTSAVNLGNETPSVLTHRKPMRTSFYTEAIEILPVDNGQELLKLTANCRDRQIVSIQYGIDYINLTIATEIADLQRTGMSLTDAAMIQAAVNPNDLKTKLELIDVTDLISGKNQTIDIGLFAQMPPKAFYNIVLDFYKNQCSNCNKVKVPSFKQLNQFIKIAQQLPILVSYQKDGTCWSTDPNSNKTSGRKPMITRSYTEAYEILPIKNDNDLLKFAADCHDREHLADHYDFPLEPLAIATEIVDLKRIGITTDIATTIHAATYIGILDVIGGRTEFIDIIDLIGNKHQTIDIGLLSLMPPKPFYNIVIDFFDNHCTSCEESVRPTFEMIQSTINKAKQLSVQISYEKEGACWSVDRNLNVGKIESRRKPMMTRTYLHTFEILSINTDQ